MPRYDFRCEAGHMFEHDCSSDDVEKPIPCQGEGCILTADYTANCGGLDHGIGLFRDQAREGRFDESNLSTRYMSSGRGSWRR